MAERSDDNWAQCLRDQGVPDEAIAAARAAAAKMASALATFTFSPDEPIAPSDHARILRAAPRRPDDA